MHRFILAAVVLTSTLAITTVQAAPPVLKPVKIARGELTDGSIFLQEGAVHNEDGTTDVVTFTSGDQAFQTGVLKSGPFHQEIRESPGLPVNEFLYFLSGSVTLTSGDGSVMTVNAGEAVSIPKGWTGVFHTEQGYTKLYVTYDPDLRK